MYLACSELDITIGYPLVDAAQRFISSFGADLKAADYLGDVRLKVAVKKSEETEFKEGLSNALSGKVDFKKIAEYYHPFEI